MTWRKSATGAGMARCLRYRHAGTKGGSLRRLSVEQTFIHGKDRLKHGSGERRKRAGRGGAVAFPEAGSLPRQGAWWADQSPVLSAGGGMPAPAGSVSSQRRGGVPDPGGAPEFPAGESLFPGTPAAGGRVPGYPGSRHGRLPAGHRQRAPAGHAADPGRAVYKPGGAGAGADGGAATPGAGAAGAGRPGSGAAAGDCPEGGVAGVTAG